ncbi:hypothetical protein BOX15_Mlig012552g4 [Macrostomum lignano]|uniref:Protein odr-4 homolog n=1 Tax=Macrostomum lignano TaxID=282301 RepID=A0A267EQG4_9PLAT|nr:hypothetical protein BOX15_Mlig012552g4 [Macrostomum lignano]
MIEHVIIDKNAFSPQLLLPGQFGLVIGQYDSDTDIRVLLHCATPDRAAGDASASPQKQDKFAAKQQQQTAGLPLLDSEWIGRHAENVSRSLPGGLDIVGLFLCSQKASASDEQVAQFKTALGRVHEFTGTSKLTKDKICSQKIILLVSSDANDISCLATDAANPVGGTSRISRCEQSTKQAWLCVTSRFTLNSRFAVSAQSAANNNLTDQLHSALQPAVERALDFSPLYEGAALPDSPPLPFDCGVGGDSAAASFSEPVFVELLQKSEQEIPYAKEIPAGSKRLEVTGCFPLFALIRSGSSGLDVSRALKSDLIRGLDARLYLAAQELSISSGLFVEGKSPALRLPRRVLVRHPRCPQAVLSDYSFPGETSQDVLDRLAYFFSTDLSPEDVNFGPEAESNSAASSPDDMSADEAEMMMEGVDRVVNTKVPLYYVFGLAVAFLAALVAVLIYKS